MAAAANTFTVRVKIWQAKSEPLFRRIAFIFLTILLLRQKVGDVENGLQSVNDVEDIVPIANR
jgi:hypothetical protein